MPYPDSRPDPDALLARMAKDGAGRKGRLFIFLGMCPGVGKTYAMLLMARQRLLEGSDVLAGVIETHGRAETAALLEGLERLPLRKVIHGEHVLEEFDLDAALVIRPELLLVDELAHTNAPGSRHRKRYQDVLELLDAGIDVCTTLNVQHIDSQVDVVRQITGVAVQETVPDSILDRAHEIQLLDLSVEKLMARLAEGKVYSSDRARAAFEGFFKEDNLTALRELALRFTAERVDRDLEDIRRARKISSPWKANARLLVAVGPTPYSESLIRWTRRTAGRIGCPWLAVWVELPQPPDASGQELLGKNLNLARRLGGEVVHAMGNDIATAVLEVARGRNVSQIVVGKTNKRLRWTRSLADRIIEGSGDIDVCVVRPVLGRPLRVAPKLREKILPTTRPREFLLTAAAIVLITTVCWPLQPVTGYTLPAMIYLLGILLAAFHVGRVPILLMALWSALCWNFFFIPPRFTLQIRAAEDVLMLGVFFAVAMSMGHLTNRLRKREIAERRRQIETDALLRVTQNAALCPSVDNGLAEALRIINGVVDADTALMVRQPDHSFPRAAHAASTFAPSEREFAVAAWTFSNKKPAGRYTDTLPESESTWFPLQTATSMMGVLGVKCPPGSAALDFTRRQALEAFALQLALVLEKEHFIQAVAHAELMDKSERLRRNLLDSVSHELKTPLAVIRASIEGLGEQAKAGYIAEIDTAAKRLQRLVEGLLQMTRVESQVIEPRLEWCDVGDVIGAALNATVDVMKTHPVARTETEGMPLIETDHGLLSQALANVLHNAAVYSPLQAPVEISAGYHLGMLEITVRDHGAGVAAGDEPRVFGKFYRSPGSPAGGTGLGLSITRGFVQALGGTVGCRNHPEGGAVFEIRLRTRSLDPQEVIQEANG